MSHLISKQKVSTIQYLVNLEHSVRLLEDNLECDIIQLIFLVFHIVCIIACFFRNSRIVDSLFKLIVRYYVTIPWSSKILVLVRKKLPDVFQSEHFRKVHFHWTCLWSLSKLLIAQRILFVPQYLWSLDNNTATFRTLFLLAYFLE